MEYTEKQERLRKALTELNNAMEKPWNEVVGAVNDLYQGIIAKTDSYDACFPPEIEHAIDHGAGCTAWIYSRLEQAAGRRTNTAKKIRKALGYNE